MNSIQIVNNHGVVQIESALRIGDEKVIDFIKDPQNKKFINALTNDLGITHRLEEGEEAVSIIGMIPDSNRFDAYKAFNHIKDLHIQLLRELNRETMIKLAEKEGKHEDQPEQELTDEEKDLIDFLDMLRPIIILV